MYYNKDFIFLELQKTGGSHILRLLSQLTDGNNLGKHNRLSIEYNDKYIFGSIRNPWDWYISLWAYGVGGKGAIRHRTTNSNNIDYYNNSLPKSMGKNRLSAAELFLAIYKDTFKPRKDWLSCYENANDPELFKKWLYLMLSKERRYDIGEGYAFSQLSKCAGLMTYRYLRLFTLGDSIYKRNELSSLDAITSFDSENNISSGMVRNEALEHDLIIVLQKAGVSLSDENITFIKNQTKTNTSERNQTNYYYDQATIDLVGDKEKFIIDKYNYKPPLLG